MKMKEFRNWAPRPSDYAIGSHNLSYLFSAEKSIKPIREYIRAVGDIVVTDLQPNCSEIEQARAVRRGEKNVPANAGGKETVPVAGAWPGRSDSKPGAVAPFN